MTQSPLNIAVWHRHPFVGQALVETLSAERYVTTAVAAPSAETLIELCHEFGATTVIIDLDDPADGHWAVIDELAHHLSARVVGLTSGLDGTSARRAFDAGVRAIVDEAGGIDAVLAELRPAGWRSIAFRDEEANPHALDDLERDVLRLIAGGRTARAIADELKVSASKVDAAKRAAFAKLGAHQQAHAVAIALRDGLLE
jgi:DNA-binding NarL/FixJ family response regulator